MHDVISYAVLGRRTGAVDSGASRKCVTIIIIIITILMGGRAGELLGFTILF